MVNLDDTQPNRPVGIRTYSSEIPAPPRFLLWGVIGLFVLGILGAFVGIYLFREALPPRYQARVMQSFPFMEAFMPGGGTIPTAAAVDPEAQSALLQLSLSLPDTTSEATSPAMVPAETTAEAEATADGVAAAATIIPATVTPQLTNTALPTPIPEPTVTTTTAPLPTPEATAQVAVPDTSVVVDTSSTTAEVDPALTRAATHTLGGFRWERQKWNNCGPTNITMALSYYSWPEDQDYAAQFLRPNVEDKNVTPQEMADFVNEQTLVRAMTSFGGDLELLRQLLYNGFPVIIEVGGTLFQAYDWIGHYRTLVGYNDSAGVFYIYDSFLGSGANGEGVTERYDVLDQHWQAFNRTFIVVYEPAREQLLMDILGDQAHPGRAAVAAFEAAQREATADPTNPFVWFNMGSSLVELARYEEAANAFDRAASNGLPWRMLWYQFGPFEAYYNAGRYDDVLSLVENNLTNNGEYVEETYYWQGRVFQAQGRTQDAINAFRTALSMNSNFTEARQALDSLS
ncbi:MAG: C39 family peptidase [bacterium]|nr:C39 family peptidase [bacterium]